MGKLFHITLQWIILACFVRLMDKFPTRWCNFINQSGFCPKTRSAKFASYIPVSHPFQQTMLYFLIYVVYMRRYCNCEKKKTDLDFREFKQFQPVLPNTKIWRLECHLSVMYVRMYVMYICMYACMYVCMRVLVVPGLLDKIYSYSEFKSYVSFWRIWTLEVQKYEPFRWASQKKKERFFRKLF
jgi:hypothetical protein